MSDFDATVIRPMILQLEGDIGVIAKKIGADSEELRSFIENTPSLRRALEEVIALGVDGSMTALFNGLKDKNISAQLTAAKVFLKSRAARRRGFDSGGDLELRMPAKGGALTLTWLPPEPMKPLPPMIEGTAVKE